MYTADVAKAVSDICEELLLGSGTRGDATVLNSGDAGLLESLEELSASDASQSIDGGASIAAHARHLTSGFALMSRWAATGSDPLSDSSWDDAWTTTSVGEDQWARIRNSLAHEARLLLSVLAQPRQVTAAELRMLVAAVGHIAYHLGAIRQIHRSARGPRGGTFR